MGFGKCVWQLVIYAYKFKGHISFLCMVSQKVFSNFYVLVLNVESIFFRYANRICIIKLNRHMVIR